ncbi:unnamed protein product [Arabidopsis lyrata]|uniref:Predicted protein n=1 Tax=Arabidopsis lyrata subsp. lyrata TaxID=81972 RepID=D7MQ60_ARALL|nr:predicted protein [Arabidopsis lyrata subsp. lyrata]CAH8279148.1 unnamed protein product [Arabidopsis lyrata]
MTKSNSYTVTALFVLLFVGVLEANEKSLLHQSGDFRQSESLLKKSVDPIRVTRWFVPPSGPSTKESPDTRWFVPPSGPSTKEPPVTRWLVPPSGPSTKESPVTRWLVPPSGSSTKEPPVTRWLVPPSGPSTKEPPIANKENMNLWSPSQRLFFGMLPKNVPIPPMEPSGKKPL